VFLNHAGKGFTPLNTPDLDRILTRSQTTVLGWRQQQGDAATLLAGSSNYQDASPSSSSVVALPLGSSTNTPSLAGAEESTGPLTMADLYGVGTLALFVGGRVSPGHFPNAVSSKIYRNHNGTFELDSENSKVLDHVGMVSGAMFSDLDGMAHLTCCSHANGARSNCFEMTAATSNRGIHQ